jgi:hypothetical protein
MVAAVIDAEKYLPALLTAFRVEARSGPNIRPAYIDGHTEKSTPDRRKCLTGFRSRRGSKPQSAAECSSLSRRSSLPIEPRMRG